MQSGCLLGVVPSTTSLGQTNLLGCSRLSIAPFLQWWEKRSLLISRVFHAYPSYWGRAGFCPSPQQLFFFFFISSSGVHGKWNFLPACSKVVHMGQRILRQGPRAPTGTMIRPELWVWCDIYWSPEQKVFKPLSNQKNSSRLFPNVYSFW